MITLISQRVENLVQNRPRPFTSHGVTTVLIADYNPEWQHFVGSYSGTRLVQERKAVQQLGRFLGRNANRLNISRGRTIPHPIIEGLTGHNPRETTEWL